MPTIGRGTVDDARVIGVVKRSSISFRNDSAGCGQRHDDARSVVTGRRGGDDAAAETAHEVAHDADAQSAGRIRGSSRSDFGKRGVTEGGSPEPGIDHFQPSSSPSAAIGAAACPGPETDSAAGRRSLARVQQQVEGNLAVWVAATSTVPLMVLDHDRRRFRRATSGSIKFANRPGRRRSACGRPPACDETPAPNRRRRRCSTSPRSIRSRPCARTSGLSSELAHGIEGGGHSAQRVAHLMRQRSRQDGPARSRVRAPPVALPGPPVPEGHRQVVVAAQQAAIFARRRRQHCRTTSDRNHRSVPAAGARRAGASAAPCDGRSGTRSPAAHTPASTVADQQLAAKRMPLFDQRLEFEGDVEIADVIAVAHDGA